MRFLTPAQCVGYVSFVLGVAGFLQKTDRRLKLFNANQCLVYAAHFVMLGNLPASAASLISSVRSFAAVRTRSPLFAAFIIVLNLIVGAVFCTTRAGWLPVIASCAATVAIFYMEGVRLRLVLLGCTMMWLANNIFSGSIGGTLLEVVIAIVNSATILRMRASFDSRREELA